MVIILFFWFGLCCLAGAIASSKGRSFVGFFLLSFFLSPVVGLLCAMSSGSGATGCAPAGCGSIFVGLIGLLILLSMVGTVAKSCNSVPASTPEIPSVAELKKELDDLGVPRSLPQTRRALPPVSTTGTTASEYENMPRFAIVGRDVTTVSIAVPKNTTRAQLVLIVNRFHDARLRGSFVDLFSPATSNGSAGRRSVVEVFVFSDPLWATSAKLHTFLTHKTIGISNSDKAFGNNIRAHYLRWGAGEAGDTGSIGYASAEGHVFTAPYTLLFRNGIRQPDLSR
jgi:hypothetical protein